MRQSIAPRNSQALAEQPDTVGDPHFLREGRLFEPVFTPSTGTLLKVIHDEVAKIQRFVTDPSAPNMAVACEGASALRTLMTQRDMTNPEMGRDVFRRKFSLTILDQVIALGSSEDNTSIVKGVLTEDYTGKSTALCESLTAGISDFNERLTSYLRRDYSRHGGCCDEIADKFKAVVKAIEEIKAEHGRKTCEIRDGSAYGRTIMEKLAPIVGQARALFELLPHSRAVAGSFEEHLTTAEARLSDFHLPDAAKAVANMAGDMMDCKNALQVIEGIAPKAQRGRPSRREPVAA